MLHLYLIPLIFALIGLAFYAVLGGADFGAGFWQLTAGKGPQAQAVREHAHAAMAPVWEANHVWLIFVLTVVWTAYPTAFGSIASTLSIPLFIAAVGIIFRGIAYALRAGAADPRELSAIDTVFSISSVLTPFALGTAIGGIASGRVPVGNAAGSQFSSWLNPTSLLIGVLAVTTAAYLAAVFLCADATKLDDQDLEEQFRRRALGAGVVAGAVALAGLGVVAGDADRIFHRLTTGAGLGGLVISLVAGVATLALVWRRQYELSRYGAAVAVAAIIAGWALAQSPLFLPGLTIEAAAAPRSTGERREAALTATRQRGHSEEDWTDDPRQRAGDRFRIREGAGDPNALCLATTQGGLSCGRRRTPSGSRCSQVWRRSLRSRPRCGTRRRAHLAWCLTVPELPDRAL